MIRRSICAIATFAAIAVLTACGSGGSGQQAEVADMLMADGEADDVKLDRSCIQGVANKLSDDDAAKILDADEGADAELSAEGEALATEIFDCIDTADLIDRVLADLPDEGIDKDCVRTELEKIDFRDLQTEAFNGLSDAMLECVDIGG